MVEYEKGALYRCYMRVILSLLILFPSVVCAQSYPSQGVAVVHPGVGQIAIVPPGGGAGVFGRGERNSAGWNTGYSVVTSTQERHNPLASIFGGSDTVAETRTQVVPNDVLGRPIRGGFRAFEEPNSAGWRTGYSAVTSTYERPEPLGLGFGGSKTVTESTTRIVPNDLFGNPIQPILPGWP